MGTDAETGKFISRDEMKALLDAAQAAKREQEAFQVAPVAPVQHWGNTDYGRIAGTGMFLALMSVGLGILCFGISLIIAALR